MLTRAHLNACTRIHLTITVLIYASPLLLTHLLPLYNQYNHWDTFSIITNFMRNACALWTPTGIVTIVIFARHHSENLAFILLFISTFLTALLLF